MASVAGRGSQPSSRIALSWFIGDMMCMSRMVSGVSRVSRCRTRARSAESVPSTDIALMGTPSQGGLTPTAAQAMW
jgi:hypothetical protein